MKKTRRIAATIAALTLAACSVAPMMMTASATNVSIASDADLATHTYRAYQIFTGTYDDDLGLQVTGWGNGYNAAGLIADKEFLALESVAKENETSTTMRTLLGENPNAAAVAQAIEKLNYTSETTQADALATVLRKYIGDATATTLSSNAQNLDAGYWIVLDSYTANADANNGNVKPDAVSKHILKVSGGDADITITPKKSYPTVVKKVKENTNVSDYVQNVGSATQTYEDYNDVADYNIGDAVPFALYGTMPSTYDDYNHYYYSFGDTLASNFTLDATSIKVTVLNATEDSVSEAELADTNYIVAKTATGFDLTIVDTKAIASITKDSVIVVTYNATLNNTAVIGLDGQENKVDLEYSNNPYNTGDGKSKPDDTDKTPEDKVIVFTYEQDIKKIDAATGAVLEGVEFVLSNAEGKYVTVDGNNRVTGWVDNKDDASKLTTGKDGICKVIGLDDGTYTLEEVTAPTGYNELQNPITLKIDATTDNSQTWTGTASDVLTAINLTVTGDPTHAENSSSELTGNAATNKGTVQATIKNDKGINLPETGGIGTVLFYTAGGVMVIGAGIVLVTKKRLGKED